MISNTDNYKSNPVPVMWTGGDLEKYWEERNGKMGDESLAEKSINELNLIFRIGTLRSRKIKLTEKQWGINKQIERIEKEIDMLESELNNL